jgi:hypothetical protein
MLPVDDVALAEFVPTPDVLPFVELDVGLFDPVDAALAPPTPVVAPLVAPLPVVPVPEDEQPAKATTAQHQP